jgi:hypothetical protein
MRFRFAMDDEREKRLKICKTCPFYRRAFPAVLSLCSVCLCVVEGKTWLKDQVCPKGKW